MTAKLSKLQIAQQKAEAVAKETNDKIAELGRHANALYISLNKIQSLFNHIRNAPKENAIKYEKLAAIRINWKQQAENIEARYNEAKIKAARQSASAIGLGVAVAAFGPTAAMGVATTFGVASTGTAISTLSGAAATNAALAWLGGGALAAGGGGMAVGYALLSLAGPVGWTIAGSSIIASGLMFMITKNNNERLENIYTLISNRDTKLYELAIIELNERIERIKNESEKLEDAIVTIETFGIDYNAMTEAQQYMLGNYVNLMEASTMLLVNPILGLQPKFSEQDFEKLCVSTNIIYKLFFTHYKNMIIPMANLLYKIKLDDKDKALLVKALNRNEEFLSSVNISDKRLTIDRINLVEKALNYKYQFELEETEYTVNH